MARAELHDLPLLIDDAAGLTMKQIRLRARRASRAFGGKLALVVIDHLHIVAADERDRDRGDTQAMGQISASVKRLAKEFNCPVLALAQLNRGVESRDDKRPNLSDLRQSGNLEQDADAVIFLFRAEYYLRDETPERKGGETQATYDAKCRAQREKIADAAGKGEAIFAKVREGATRTVHLTWHAETTSFEDSYQ
jgi:replicative DNA helicase